MLLLRIRTKDGTERLQVDTNATLAGLRELIETKLTVPRQQQLLSRSVQRGPIASKGEPFAASEEQQPLRALGVANGDLIFLDYEMERENTAVSQAYAKDPFRKEGGLIQEGELRAQNKRGGWTLTDYLLYRSTKEFVLQAPPEPHVHFVEVDQRASSALINHMILSAFSCKRVGYLLGKWVEHTPEGSEEEQAGVQVHAIYEPPQDNTDEEINLTPDPEGEEKMMKMCALLGLTMVGVIIAHPAREYAFSINELLLAAKLHAAAVAADEKKGARFVTMKARPVLESETEIEGVATVEAYQVTDQFVELATRDEPVLSQSKTDPRVCKTAKDTCFVVEKKEVRKATYEHFIARVFDIGRPFRSSLSCSFQVENRATEPQSAQSLADYLRPCRSRREAFVTSCSDFHFLMFLTGMLDINTDMPVLCAKVRDGDNTDLEGFQMMIYCYAGMD